LEGIKWTFGLWTPTGLFNVQRLDANYFSDEYDQSPMPYSIFFYEGLAIHGTYQGGLGRPASHGCVRLAIPHARMLYSCVKQYGASIEINGMATETLITYDSLVTDRRRIKKRSNGPSIMDDSLPSGITGLVYHVEQWPSPRQASSRGCYSESCGGTNSDDIDRQCSISVCVAALA
jgi:hypothetical protein